MDFFNMYVSDTLAGSANQTVFNGGGIVRQGRVYYKLFCGGDEYSLLFTNTTDSTFADGSRSVCNTPCPLWEIFEVKAGLCAACDIQSAAEPPEWQFLTFGGERRKTVASGEVFCCDPFMLQAKKGEYLCLDITFGGHAMPCHEELWVASFVQEGTRWLPSKRLPLPSMIGVRRMPEKRVAFLGDSITQGIGSTPNSYQHWNARVADKLGTDYAFWNLGIGYARSGDASSDGAWLQKAKQNDVVVLCLGVNDLLQGMAANVIFDNLKTVITLLQARGIKVILQSVPPFEYPPKTIPVWRVLNGRLKAELAPLADGWFDNTAFLTSEDLPRYGGHPNDEGCRIWAEQLYAYLTNEFGI